MPKMDVAQRRSSDIVSLRLTAYEDAAVRKAAEAMGVTVSQLVEVAATDAAHRLGFFDAGDPPIRRLPKWTDAPDRSGDSTSRRISVTLSLLRHELTLRAAEYIRDADGENISHALFIIGATLRYIANRKRTDPQNKALRSVVLPEKYS
jgi:hypothetical protein